MAENQIDAILDAAGFAYSDQWGAAPCEQLASLARRWQLQGKRTVLLPQAFGPFRSERSRSAMRRALDHIDLVFARDAISLYHLTELGTHRARVEQAPDFTIAVDGFHPPSFEPAAPAVAIIPNARMIDKISSQPRSAYTDLLIELVKHLGCRRYHPFLLVHDTTLDHALASEISGAMNGIPIVTETDPRALKAIIGACHAVVGSRFHALVGAMTQGIPALGTGWSHKYDELFREFGCPEALHNVGEPISMALERLDRLLDGRERDQITAALLRTARQYAQRTDEMWFEVAGLLGIVRRETD